MPRMTDKKREEDRKVHRMEAESDPDTSSNMFASFHRQTLSCLILQKSWAPCLIHFSEEEPRDL